MEKDAIGNVVVRMEGRNQEGAHGLKAQLGTQWMQSRRRCKREWHSWEGCNWEHSDRKVEDTIGTQDAIGMQRNRKGVNTNATQSRRSTRAHANVEMKGEVWGGFSLLFFYYMSRFYLYKVKLSVSRYRVRAHGVGVK